MNALRLDPSERLFATIYEPRTRPRFTRKTLLAIGITAVAYGGLGFYFLNQKYDLAPAPVFQGPTVIEGSWTVLPKPPKPDLQRDQQPEPVRTRQPPTTIPTDAPTTTITPNDVPLSDATPTTADPVITPPVASSDPPAPPVLAPPGIIRNPVWISRPTAEQVGRLYPERALERGVTGSATLWCGIRANGTMTACQVVDETPAGAQFGKAALAMAQYFRISPLTVDGKPVEGSRVRIPVVFSLAN